MKKFAFGVAIAAVLGLAAAPHQVEAKGCLMGAAVGAVAGHMAHHGVLGAVGGCVGGLAVHKLYVTWQQKHPGGTMKDFVSDNKDRIQSLGVDPSSLESAAGFTGGK